MTDKKTDNKEFLNKKRKESLIKPKTKKNFIYNIPAKVSILI